MGQGGNGIVYLGEDVVLKKKWAIKQLEKSKENLMEEALLMCPLDHPGIPRITEVLEDENFHYIVMDYCQGRSLREYCLKNKVAESEIISWAVQLCDILTYLHQQNPPIIFRDIKPDNIILGENNRIKLIDFGIATNQSGRDARGTKGFAAPEQYKGYYSVQSDIYNLGASLFWCAKTMHIKSLNKVIKRAMKKNPAKRYQNSEQLKEKLLKLQKKRNREKARIRFWVVLIMLISSIGIAFAITEKSETANPQIVKQSALEVRRELEKEYFTKREKYLAQLNRKKEILEAMLKTLKEDGNEEKV